MSDLRESILQAIPLRNPTYHRIADGVLSAIAAHMAVTDRDVEVCFRSLPGFGNAHFEAQLDDCVRVLEVFVARKLKAEYS